MQLSMRASRFKQTDNNVLHEKGSVGQRLCAFDISSLIQSCPSLSICPTSVQSFLLKIDPATAVRAAARSREGAFSNLSQAARPQPKRWVEPFDSITP
jgi:hypothetical protein